MKYVYTLIIGAESECLSYDRKVKKYDVNLLFFSQYFMKKLVMIWFRMKEN